MEQEDFLKCSVSLFITLYTTREFGGFRVRGIPRNLVLDRSIRTTVWGHHSSPQWFKLQPHNDNMPSLVSEGFVALSFVLFSLPNIKKKLVLKPDEFLAANDSNVGSKLENVKLYSIGRHKEIVVGQLHTGDGATTTLLFCPMANRHVVRRNWNSNHHRLS